MADDDIDKNAFWNMNIPTELHTKECPEFLDYAFTSDKDRGILSTLDADYHRQTWEEVKRTIQENRIDVFDRFPSDLRRYREYCAKLAKEHGDVMTFVVEERLKWEDLTPKGEPFVEPGKYTLSCDANL